MYNPMSKRSFFAKYLGANARQLVQQKYDWEIISNKLDIVYQKLKSSSRNL